MVAGEVSPESVDALKVIAAVIAASILTVASTNLFHSIETTAQKLANDHREHASLGEIFNTKAQELVASVETAIKLISFLYFFAALVTCSVYLARVFGADSDAAAAPEPGPPPATGEAVSADVGDAVEPLAAGDMADALLMVYLFYCLTVIGRCFTFKAALADMVRMSMQLSLRPSQ